MQKVQAVRGATLLSLVCLVVCHASAFDPISGIADRTAQAMVTVYDGRAEDRAQLVSAGDRLLIQRTGIDEARRHWGNQCEPGVEFVGAAEGSFTRQKSKQRAVLYRYCETGHNFANNGLAVIESGTLVAHFAYNGGSDHTITSLPDVNGNGLSELVLAGGSTNQGYTIGVVSVIEIDGRTVTQFGDADTFSSDCGAVERGCKTIAYRIMVKPGPRPTFTRESYRSVRQAWTRLSAERPLRLRKSYQEPERVFTPLS